LTLQADEQKYNLVIRFHYELFMLVAYFWGHPVNLRVWPAT